MGLFKRKPKELTEEQRRQVEWLKKVWCPLHIRYPSSRDQQAVISGALWMKGEPGPSFLAATGGADMPGFADRWRRMNPGEDFNAWIEELGEEIATRMNDDPSFRQAIFRAADEA